jgi:hypothetical protein
MFYLFGFSTGKLPTQILPGIADNVLSRVKHYLLLLALMSGIINAFDLCLKARTVFTRSFNVRIAEHIRTSLQTSTSPNPT